MINCLLGSISRYLRLVQRANWRFAAMMMLSMATLRECQAGTDWPQFLGPHRNGISAETGLIEKFPADGPKEIWRVKGGDGMSGLAVADGTLVTMVQRDGQQFVVAINVLTGAPIWEKSVAPEYRNAMGAGPRGTPTIHGGTVLAFTGEGVLASLNAIDGKVVWSRPILSELNGRPAEYGMACSPLVVGDQVVLTLGAPKAAVVALDLATGKTRWTTGEDATGYSSPALFNAGGQQHLVVFTGSSALGLRPASGQILWRYPYKTDFDCNIATPVNVDGNVFISAGENHGASLLKLIPKDAGSLRVEEIWSSHGGDSVMRNEWQTSILADGYLYGLDNVGGAGPITHLTCIKAATGERVWQKERFGKSNLIWADGKLWIATLRGELVVVRATPKGYEELGRAKVFKGSRTAPAVADGRLYLRDDREIVCLRVKEAN